MRRTIAALCVVSSVACLLSGCGGGGGRGGPPSPRVFTEGFGSGWDDVYAYSWDCDIGWYLNNPDQAHSGKMAVRVRYVAPWGGLAFHALQRPLPLTGLTECSVWLRAVTAHARVRLLLQGKNAAGQDVEPGAHLSSYGPDPIPVGTYAQYRVPLADLGMTDGSVWKVSIVDDTGVADTTIVLDDLMFR